MNLVLFLTLLVSVAWGQSFTTVRITGNNEATGGPATTRIPVTTTRVTLTTTTAPTPSPTDSVCLDNDLEDALDNPEDQQHDISQDESRQLLTALEAEGIEEERRAAEARSATFAAPNITAIWPCVTPDGNCPHVYRRLTRFRSIGPCGVEICTPVPWYKYTYAVCKCTHCLRGRGRCVPTRRRSYLLLAFCYYPLIGRRIRAVRVALPTSCTCRSRC